MIGHTGTSTLVFIVQNGEMFKLRRNGVVCLYMRIQEHLGKIAVTQNKRVGQRQGLPQGSLNDSFSPKQCVHTEGFLR